MAKRRNHRNRVNESKTELAKSIAETSKSIKKTYANVESKVMKAFRSVSSALDFLLFNERFSKLVAVCLAAILYLVINGGTKDSMFASNIKQSIVLEKVQVTTNISDNVYEVEGLPETVKVTVRGESSDVQFASQQQGNYQVLANLSDLSEGMHEVRLEPLNFSSKVEVSIEPSTVMVTIKKKVSKSYTIGYDFINTDKLDKIYSLGEPEFSQNEVIVRASEERMNEISYVKALIDVDGVKADFEKDAKLVAYNQKGETIDVDILPETVRAKVKVTTPSKEVPIEIVPEGEMEDGLSIESYELDHKTMTIYAPQNILDTIDKITISVPVNKISEDTSITMPIMLPNGVSKGSVTKVNIKIKVQSSASKDVEDVEVHLKNHDEKFNVVFADGSNKVVVNVAGSKSALEAVTAKDITVILDLEGYDKPGTYDIPLTVTGNNTLLTYTLKKETIRITLEEK